MNTQTERTDNRSHRRRRPPAEARKEGPSSGKKLLLVDDDLCMREITEHLLNENGYACTAAESARKAIDRLQRDQFDLVITDLHMPDIDGMALLEWIKRRLPKTKVMIMTGDADQGLKSHALQRGVANYLMKPFTLETFLREIEGSLITKPMRQP